MRKTALWISCVLGILARGDGLEVQVNDTTATQAILSYTAPDNNPCSIAVSESSSLSPLVNDVNPALFSGGDSDQRGGNVVSGKSRIAVIGKRTAERALDGNLYSRALQAFTQHYFTVACGASTGSGTFTTKNPPLGNSAPDTVPFVLGAWGNAGWPSMDWSDASKHYIDPLTGLLIERITGPGQSGGTIAQGLPFYYIQDAAGAWTNPQNILGADQNFTSYSGPGGQGNALFLPASAGLLPGFTSNYVDDDLRLRISGYTDQSATLSACITVDHGQSCTGSVVTLPALPQGSSKAAEIAGPASFPSPLFAGWGQLKISGEQIQALAGTVAVSGSAVAWTSTAYGANGTTYFPLSLRAGDHILIAGSDPVCPQNDCTIASLVDAKHLTIAQDLGSWTGFSTTLSAATAAGAKSFTLTDTSGLIRDLGSNRYTFQFADAAPESMACTTLTGSTLSGCNEAASAHASGALAASTAFSFTNFGVLLWKTAGTNGSVFLDYANYDLAQSDVFSVGYDGSANFCSVQTVQVNYAADGVTALNPPLAGRTCQFLDWYGNPNLYLFIPQTGEARQIAYGDPVKGNGGTAPDPSDPNIFYYAQNNSPNPNVYKCTYNASAGHYAALSPNYTNAPSPNFNCTNITGGAGNDLITQISRVMPGFDPAYFNRVSGFGGIAGNYISVTVQLGQNSIGYSCFFDVSQPVGSQVVGCHDTWTTYPERWGGAHGTFQTITRVGWGEIFLVPLNSQGTTGIGLYQFSVNSITGESGTTALTSTVSSDPTTQNCSTLGVTDPRWIALGATGNNCIQMVVATEPQNVAPSAADLAKWPSACNAHYSQLQTIQPGDYLYDNANGLYGEQFLVAGKTASGCSPITLVLARGVNQASNQGCAAAPQAHANGWVPVVGATANCDGNVYWFQAANPSAVYADNSGVYLGHTFTGPADNTGTNLGTYTVYAASSAYTGYGVRRGSLPGLIGQPYGYGVNMIYPFAGSTAGVGIGYIQSHPGGQSYFATPNTLGYDGRPLGGAGGGLGTIWYHTLTLASGTSQVYRISCPLSAASGGNCIDSLDRKRLGMVAFAGRFLLKDVSGPGSSITDSNPYTYCIADFAGECRPGSSQGDRFVNVPNIDTSGICIVGALDVNTPCLATAPAEVGQATQYDWGAADPNGINWRRLGYAFMGPGQTNNYWNVHGIVDASWAFTEVDWKEGVRKDIFAIKLPPWPGPSADGIKRSDFVRLVIPIQGQAGDSVRIRFGYDTNLYCTSRREPCTAAGAAPFTWLSETRNAEPAGAASSTPTIHPPRPPGGTFGIACPTTCEVDIPALSGRVLYYVVDHLSNGGRINSSTMQVVAVP